VVVVEFILRAPSPDEACMKEVGEQRVG